MLSLFRHLNVTSVTGFGNCPKLWNSRSDRLEGKSKEAVDTNAMIERILLSFNTAVDSLIKRNMDFTATTVKEMLQGNVNGLYVMPLHIRIIACLQESR